MLRHPADREILRLAVPALGALAAEPLYVLVDTAVVGHLGTPQLGGLAVAGTVLTTAFFLFNFLAYGTTAAVARYLGAEEDRAAAIHAVQGAWLAVALGVVLATLGVVFAPGAIALFGADGEVAGHGVVYLRISALGAPAVLLTLVGVGYLRGQQDTRTTLVVALGSNVINLLLELVLIYGLDFGIGASAAATVVAQVCAAAAYGVVVRRRVGTIAISLRPDQARLRAQLVVGGDLVIRTGSLLGALAVATAVASRMGQVPLAAHQVAFQLWSFLALLLDAIAIAGQAIVGRRLGAGDASAARESSRRMIQWGIVGGVAFGAVVLLVRPALASLFSSDPRVVALASQVLLIVAVLQPINAVVFVLDGVLIGAGDLRYLALTMAACSLLLFLPAAGVVHAAGAGLVALWGALTLLMAGRLAGNLSRFRGDRWQVVGAGQDV